MKLRHASAPVALACICLFALLGCGKKEAAGAADTSETVATVNGQPITAKDYYDYMIRKSTVLVNGQQGPQQAQTVGPIGLQALRDMVDRKLMLQLAKEEGVLPTDADVDKEIASINKEKPGYTDEVLKNGVSMEELKDETLLNLARERLITKGVIVSAAEVDSYIKENPKQFTEPAVDDLLIVAANTADKEKKIDAALKAGKAFKDVASQLSDAPNGKRGGALGKVPIANLPPDVKAALDKTAPLHYTDWIKVGSSFVRFYVVSKTPESKVKLTPEQKQQLQRQLALQRGQATNDLGPKMLAKLKAASVDVSMPMLKRPWSQVEAQIKSAQMPPTGGAPGAAPSPGARPGPTTGKPSAPPAESGSPHF